MTNQLFSRRAVLRGLGIAHRDETDICLLSAGLMWIDGTPFGDVGQVLPENLAPDNSRFDAIDGLLKQAGDRRAKVVAPIGKRARLSGRDARDGQTPLAVGIRPFRHILRIGETDELATFRRAK